MIIFTIFSLFWGFKGCVISGDKRSDFGPFRAYFGVPGLILGHFLVSWVPGLIFGHFQSIFGDPRPGLRQLTEVMESLFHGILESLDPGPGLWTRKTLDSGPILRSKNTKKYITLDSCVSGLRTLDSSDKSTQVPKNGKVQKGQRG